MTPNWACGYKVPFVSSELECFAETFSSQSDLYIYFQDESPVFFLVTRKTCSRQSGGGCLEHGKLFTKGAIGTDESRFKTRGIIFYSIFPFLMLFLNLNHDMLLCNRLGFKVNLENKLRHHLDDCEVSLQVETDLKWW